MKSRTSYFNRTILRSDLTRFAPVWILYTLGFLVMQIMLLTRCTNEYGMANMMNEMMQLIIPANGLYALLVAAILFNDLLTPRMCNALHALPLTRDDFFCTHALAGFCFSVIPNALVMLVSLPLLGRAAPTAMYFFVVALGSYIFYFGTALLSIQLSGNQVAAVLIYGLLNFWSLLIVWFARYLVEPMMYGVDLPIRELFFKLCPTESLIEKPFLYVTGVGDDWRYLELGPIYRSGDWAGLGIWTLVGMAALAAAQILYRRRKLEVAGDLVAYKSTRPFFMVMFTVMVAGFWHVAAQAMEMSEGIPGILMVVFGLTVGWLIGLMLLERQMRVFTWKKMLPLAYMIAALVLIVMCTVFDVFGVVYKLPEMDQVTSIEMRCSSIYGNRAKIKDPARMQQLYEMHRQELADYRARGVLNAISGNKNGRNAMDQDTVMSMELVYKMKDGSEMKRTYDLSADGPYADLLRSCLNQTDAVFNTEFADTEELVSKIVRADVYVYTGGSKDLAKDPEFPSLLEAILADCREGTMHQVWNMHRFDVGIAGLDLDYDELDPNQDYSDVPYYQMHPEQLPTNYAHLNLYMSSRNTLNWLLEHGYLDQDTLDQYIEEMRSGAKLG